MALRVLLGDESSTIKKVFQLALQDFAVEVRPVNIGTDVAMVATSFQPDIVFIDVLLQKKNGYDVTLELKSNEALKHVPVVLMWSGFMELDEDKFEASMANAQLEKPFDVTALRRLVTDLVPRTNNQRISQFLSFPKMPDLEEKAAPPPPPAAHEPAEAQEDFQAVPIPKMKKAEGDKFRLNLKPEELDPEGVPVKYDVPAEKITLEDVFKTSPEAAVGAPVDEPEEFSIRDTRRPSARPALSVPEPAEISASDLEVEDLVEIPSTPPFSPPAAAAMPTALSAEQLEKIIRQQSAEVIESVVWKVIPELATQIIERELNRLLKEHGSHPY